MIGYGNEDENFVIELTYNYGISAYKRGNDFRSIHISSPGGILDRVKEGKLQYTEDGPNAFTLVSPCGYTFTINEGGSSQSNGNYLTNLFRISNIFAPC